MAYTNDNPDMSLKVSPVCSKDFEVGYLFDDTLLLLLTGFFFLCLRLASFVAVHISTSETRYFTSFEINIVNNLIKNKRFDTRYIDIRCYRHR